MSAPTVAVQWLLARAAVRSTGLLHIVSERDSGALNPMCAANPIRSEVIERRHHLDDLALLCPGCATLAASIGGTVVDGVAMMLGLSGATPTARLLEVDVDAVISATEPRRAGKGLVASVQANGVMTPVLVRRTGRGLQLLDGSRRLAAARAAGLATVPAVVRDLDEQHAVVAALSANLHREDLDPIAQATAYVDALAVLGVTQKQLAEGLGISAPQVSNTIRLLKLPEHLRTLVAERLLTAEQGRSLLACSSEEEQDVLADQLLAGRAVRRSGAQPPLDPQLAAIADLLAQAVEAKVAIRTRGTTTEFVFRVPTAERDRLLATLTPAV